MRVTLLTFDFGEQTVPLASAMAEHAEVQLVLPDRELTPFRAELDAAVHAVPYHKPRYRQPAHQMRMIGTIVRAVRRFDPDVVHIQQGHLWFNLALPALRRYPLVLTVHDPRPHPGDRGAEKTPQFVTNLAYRRADRVIVHARYLRDALVEGWQMDPESIDVIPLAFADTDDVTEPPDDGVFRILFFGRIWPYKGLDCLIDAEPLITAEAPSAHVVVAGTGEPFDRYRQRMRHPERFTVDNSFVSFERRDQLFREADVVVLPYLEATQTAVIPLAYRIGRPVVATTVGGLPEVVEDGATGLLVPPGDPEALAAAIVRLARDPEGRAAMGRRARGFFEETFSADVLARQTLECCERVLSEHAPRPS